MKAPPPKRARVVYGAAELHKISVSGDPPDRLELQIDGRWPDDLHDLRIIGRSIDAHKFAERLLRVVAKAQREGRKQVLIPNIVASVIACALLARPGSGRGRPRKPTTNDALDLVKAGTSKHRAAVSIAESSDEDTETIRRRLRPSKPRPRKPRTPGRN